ncbi:iron-sulfur cluster assembly scaffold protein [Oceanibacterium hippocampi]|uniref:NIF system FeS cluster assembly NifU N-terminal domain-containing protein n=1 Tax=Oceanibacterium hippocampi TaxID=745714 RepID=A0A1Y5T9X1_9PROT|nr:iron-sulfur cluster assembly scaffold protein [Oceanibacterium hippocampi]SLN58840.1 hypothetical protein OCH7691_02588 [Oceanibacterium hippocampi]
MVALKDLYTKEILRYALEIPLTDRLDAPDGAVSLSSPVCGSRYSVSLTYGDGRVTGFSHAIKACALGQAAASVLARHVVGATGDELRDLRERMWAMLKREGEPPTGPWAELEALLPVRDLSARHGSVMLPFEAVVQAIDEIEGRTNGQATPLADVVRV